MKKIFLSLIATAILISSCGTGNGTSEASVDSTVTAGVEGAVDSLAVKTDSLVK
jgi:hypothetical protein